MLRHPYCGLGQIALNYGRWYGDHADVVMPDGEVTLLVPRDWVGRFGQQVRYLEARDIYRFVPMLMPRFDVWHSIHQFSPFSPSCSSTHRLLTIHDVNFMYEKSGRKRDRYLRRLRRECGKSAAICFISRFAKEDASRYIDLRDKDIHVVYDGVEDTTTGKRIAPDGVDMSKPFFLSIGVVRPKKYLHVLLPLMERMEGYNLYVAGDCSGGYADGLRRNASRLQNVKFLGPVGEAQRRWLYAHCAALLFPSQCEGFGLPVIEAMQWGKPVFCSTATSLPEVGGSHAFYFCDFAPDAMEETVCKGLADFTEARATAEREYAAGFDYDRHMRRYAELIAALGRGKR